MINKKWKKLIIAGAICLASAGLFALGNNNSAQAATKKSPNSLIIYFSKTGNTAQAAKSLQRETGAKLLRITPKKAYPTDYDDTTQVAKREIRKNTHPAIKTKLPSIKKYRHIYIGYPTWWGQPPMIIHTLFDRYDFRGKIITPFTVSAESPISSSMPIMRRLAKKDHAKITKGYRYTNRSGLRNFLISIGVLKRTKRNKQKRSNTNLTTNNLTNSRSLIVFFSMSDSTQRAAREIQRLTNSNIYRIQAADPYPSDYDGYAKRGDNERRNNLRPAIQGTIPNWNKYTIIYLGFPTWWQQPPMIIHTLFDDYSFKGKTIVPFTTSMSTPMSSSMPYIRRMASKDRARVLNGFRYTGNNTALANWIRSLKLTDNK